MTSKNLFLNSIYRATEGEGLLIGRPQIFVRVQGCAIGCANCDSKETWEFDRHPPCNLDQAMAKILALSNHKLKRVSITGGDPLHPKHVPGILQLARELKSQKFFISLEASGMRIDHAIFDLIDFINFDFKPPSTKVERTMEMQTSAGMPILPAQAAQRAEGQEARRQIKLIAEMAEQYPNKFQVKSVTQDARDFEAILKAYHYVQEKLQANGQKAIPFEWILTPVYNPGEEFPLERFKLILELNENSGGVFRVIGQQHKWIYGPNEKQV